MNQVEDKLYTLSRGDTLVTESLCCETEETLEFVEQLPEEAIDDPENEVKWVGRFVSQDYAQEVYLEYCDYVIDPELGDTQLQKFHYDENGLVGGHPTVLQEEPST